MEKDSGEDFNKKIVALGKGGGITLFIQMISMGLMFLFQTLVARSLGPETYGLFAIGWAIVQIGARLGPLGLHLGVVKFGASLFIENQEKFQKFIVKVFPLAIVISGLMWVLIFSGARSISQWFLEPALEQVLRYVAFVVATYIYLRILAAIMRAAQRVDFYTLTENLFPAIFMVFGLIIVDFWMGIELNSTLMIVVVAYFAAAVGATFVIFVFFPGILKSGAKKDLNFSYKKLLFYSLPISVTGAFAFLTQKITRVIIGYFLPVSAAGIYQAASQIAVMPTVIMISLNSMFSPLIPPLSKEKKTHQLDELYKINTKWGVYLSLPLFFVLIIFPAEVLKLTFGPAYEQGAIVLVILALGQLMNTMSGGVGILLNMTGHQTSWMVSTGISFVVTLALNWLGSQKMGLVGAALANTIGISLMYLIGLILTRKFVKVFPYDFRYWKGLVSLIITIMAMFFVSSFNFPMFYKLLSGLFVAFVVFVSCLFLLGLDEEDIIFLKAIHSRITELRN